MYHAPPRTHTSLFWFLPNSSEPHVITDEDTIQAIKECLTDDPESLPYVLGCYVGYIIGKCH